MATALGIAAVTHVLKDLLNNGLIDQDVTGIVNGNVTVTALPPDRIDLTEGNEPTGLNLFMYQATPNIGWRNEGLPAYDGRGQRVANPPLALDLHYFLSAYGAEEGHADILLGYGMQLFHDVPTLPRDLVRQSLSGAAIADPAQLPATLRALNQSGLADQVEQIKITPESLGAEELSRMWTAFQAKYRPTAAYKVTVVLIQRQQTTRVALPVLEPLATATPVVTPLADVPPPVLPVVNNVAYANVSGAGAALRTGNLTLTLATPPTARQDVLVLLNGIDAATTGHDYSFTAPMPAPGAAPSPTRVIVVRSVVPGRYLVRARVGGIDSELTTNAAGVYDAPDITIA